MLVAPAAAVIELALDRAATRAAAHHEDTNRRLVGRLAWSVVGKPAREVLELLVEVAIDAPDAVGPEVDLMAERRVAAHPHVAPGADHEALRRAVLPRHRREVVCIRPCPRVEPARRDRHRHVCVLVEVSGEVALDPRPPVVVGAARVVVDQRLLERRHEAQRGLPALPRRGPEELTEVPQVVPDLLRERGVVEHLLGVLGMDEQRPEHVALHRAALAGAVRVVVRRHDVRPDRRQVRRPLERRADLHLAGVRAADGADAAVAPRLGGDPLDDVVAVVAGVRRRRMEVRARALGAIAVAHVDEHDGVAARDEEVGDLRVTLRRLVVRRVEHDRREAALGEAFAASRTIDVERQPNAVPHGDHDVLRNDDAVPVGYPGITGRRMWDGRSASR